jgi:tetratricopeptide (TPR) repeat protein
MAMIKLIGLVLLLTTSFRSASAQNHSRIDSLSKALSGILPDTLRVNILLDLAQETYLSDPLRAEAQSIEAIELAEKSSYDRGRTMAYGWLAYLAEQKGNIEKALHYYQKSLELAEQLNNHKSAAICLNNIAAIYKDQGRVDEAIKLHEKSLSISKNINFQNGIADSYNNIGLIYFAVYKKTW